MIDFDREAWIYIALIAVALLYFFWNSRRARKIRRDRKNKNFRRRYMDRKRELGKEEPSLKNEGSRIHPRKSNARGDSENIGGK